MENTNASPATPPTVEELQATVTAHEGVIAGQKTALETLQAKVDELTAADAQKASDLAEATTIIAGQKTTIDQHEATIATLQGVKSETGTVTVDGKVYAITAATALISKDRTVTAQEIIDDKKLAAELVKKGVGFLELISKKGK